jgi:AP-3 complex subunit delta-1
VWSQRRSVYCVLTCPRYLSSPLSAISDILTPTLSACSPSLISISLQATAKIFGSHCADVSSRWNSDTHEQTKALVTSLQSGYSTFLSHPEIEVQERAVEFSQLLAFMDADLASHIPPKPKLNGDLPGMEGGFEDPNDSDNPPYPKSLFLFQPLFTSHELNAVALHAQGAVRVPEGLDLERDIVPAGGFVDSDLPELESEEDEEEAIELGAGGGAGMEELRKVLREQEGKKKKGKGKKKDGELTAEEKADKERVRRVPLSAFGPFTLWMLADVALTEKSGEKSSTKGQPILSRREGGRGGCGCGRYPDRPTRRRGARCGW